MSAAVPVLTPASPLARPIADLAWLTFGLGLAVFVLITVLTFYFVRRFRHRGAEGEPAQVFGDNPEEVGWLVGAALILVVLGVASWWAQARADPAEGRDGTPDLVVTGHQWFWSASYQGGARTANEIHIPTGRRLLVELVSADVIHDFWVPQLGRKMDVIPGQRNRVWIQADRPGTYLGACAEFCGAEHAWMRFNVIAQTPAEFQAWLSHQSQPAASDPGAALFTSLGCGNCHAVRGTGAAGQVGPDLTHFASRSILAGGVLANTPGNLTRWLRDPEQVKPGTHMPRYPYSPAQLHDLVAYLDGLK